MATTHSARGQGSEAAISARHQRRRTASSDDDLEAQYRGLRTPQHQPRDWERPTPQNLAALKRASASKHKRVVDDRHKTHGHGSQSLSASDDDDDVDERSHHTNSDGGQHRPDPATADPDAETPAAEDKPAPKNRKPRPKLDAERLLGNDGILKLHQTFLRQQFRGKGYEQADLAKLMRLFQHWAHELFPRYALKDFALTTERVGTTKRMRLHLQRWRMDPNNITMLSTDMIDAADAIEDRSPDDQQRPLAETSDGLMLRSAMPSDSD